MEKRKLNVGWRTRKLGYLTAKPDVDIVGVYYLLSDDV